MERPGIYTEGFDYDNNIIEDLENAFFIIFRDDNDNPKYANAYFFRGEKYHILIDCLSGRNNLYNILPHEGKEIKVLLTHSHLDHAAGLKHFSNANVTVYIGSNESDIIKKGEDPDNIKQKYFRLLDDITVVPFSGNVEILRDQQVFELENGSSITALYSPGHSAESFCFYTSSYGGILFTGDTFYDEPINMLQKFCVYDWELQKQTIIKLSRIEILENVWPGHGEECKEALLKIASKLESKPASSKKPKVLLECRICLETKKKLYYDEKRPHLIFCGESCQRKFYYSK